MADNAYGSNLTFSGMLGRTPGAMGATARRRPRPGGGMTPEQGGGMTPPTQESRADAAGRMAPEQRPPMPTFAQMQASGQARPAPPRPMAQAMSPQDTLASQVQRQVAGQPTAPPAGQTNDVRRMATQAIGQRFTGPMASQNTPIPGNALPGGGTSSPDWPGIDVPAYTPPASSPTSYDNSLGAQTLAQISGMGPDFFGDLSQYTPEQVNDFVRIQRGIAGKNSGAIREGLASTNPGVKQSALNYAGQLLPAGLNINPDGSVFAQSTGTVVGNVNDPEFVAGLEGATFDTAGGAYTPGNAPRPPAAAPAAAPGGGAGASGGAYGNIEQSLQDLLDNPSPYSTDAMQELRGLLTGNITQQFGAARKKLDEDMARRGIYDSSIAGGYYGDLEGQQSNALANLDAQLLQDNASLTQQGRLAGLDAAMGWQSNRFNQGLAEGELTGTYGGKQTLGAQQLNLQDWIAKMQQQYQTKQGDRQYGLDERRLGVDERVANNDNLMRILGLLAPYLGYMGADGALQIPTGGTH